MCIFTLQICIKLAEWEGWRKTIFYTTITHKHKLASRQPKHNNKNINRTTYTLPRAREGKEGREGEYAIISSTYRSANNSHMKMGKTISNWRNHFDECWQSESVDLKELIERSETMIFSNEPEFGGDSIIFVIRSNETKDVAMTKGCCLVDLLLSKMYARKNGNFKAGCRLIKQGCVCDLEVD